MESEPKFVPVSIYDPDHLLLLVVLKTKNIPGSLGDIGTRLGKAGMNILSVSNYAVPTSEQSFISFFAQAKDRRTTEDDVRKVVMASPFVTSSFVRRSESPFLINDFAFPLMFFPSGRGVLFPQSGVVAMFQELVQLYGSGGESILFRAGSSVGREGADELAKLLGEKGMVESSESLTRLYAAKGWGKMELADYAPDYSTYRLKVVEGFESEGVRASKPNCHFSRGLVAGSSERVFGRPMDCQEEKCAAMGDPYCLFRVTAKERDDVSRSGSSAS